MKVKGRNERLEGARVSSEPCKPTTSACGRPTHFVRRKGSEIRNMVTPVRFTAGEHQTIKEQAEARRLSLSEFIRRIVLGRKIPAPIASELSRDLYQELGRIGNNLNQVTRAVNRGTPVVCDLELLQRLRTEVSKLGLAMLHGHA